MAAEPLPARESTVKGSLPGPPMVGARRYPQNVSAKKSNDGPRPSRSWDDVRAERPPREDAVAEPGARMMREQDETELILGDADAMSDIAEGDAAYADGDVVRGVDEVRRLRP